MVQRRQCLIHLVVLAMVCHELPVGAGLDDFPLVQEDNAVGTGHRGKPVGNDDAGAFPGEVAQ